MTSAPPTAVRTRRFLRVPAAARPSGRTALAGLVVALVVGIVGMHALASHGTPAAPASASSAMSMPGMTAVQEAAMPSGGSRAAHSQDLPAAQLSDHASASAGVDVSGSGSGSGHGMAGMVMLCVVMLAAVGITLLVVFAAGLFRPLLPVAFMPAAVRTRALQWVRGTGPPHEWQFSVIRC